MRARLTRLGLVAGGLLALLGTTTPPAQAITTISTTFVGTATITAGLGSPVTTAGPGVLPVTPTTECLPLNGVAAPPNCHTNVQDTRKVVTVESDVLCTDTTTNVTKPNKEPVHTGDCSFGGIGYVTGHCGNSGGQVAGTYRDSLGQLYNFDVHFNGVGGTVEFSGHWSKVGSAQHGLVAGDTAAVPPTPTGPGGSCLAGNATIFTLAGDAVWVTTPL